jgi:signal-transduction protein with cAMP-binding, CBS, and nucleotidyltransferase domain
MEKIQNIPKELLTSTINLDYRTPMSSVIMHLKKYPAVVLYKDKDYYGIVDSRSIYRARHGLKLQEGEKVERFVTKVPQITNSTQVYELVNSFYKSGVKALPYSNGSKITGVLERRTLLKVLLSLNLVEGIQINQAMTTPVLAIDSRASISQAKAVMDAKRVNRLIVLQNGKFSGLITNYDISKQYARGGERLPEMKTKMYSPSNVAISSVMERNARSIEYNRPLAEAIRDMIESRISSLIVLKKGNPIGIVTVTDVFESILARQKVEPSKVFMSGFDRNTYPYEEEAKQTLNSLVGSIERLSGMDVDYVTLKVKRSKSKLYEMQIRLSLGRHGIISMHTTKYMFDEALDDLIKNLKHKVIKEKESILTHKRELVRDLEE